MASGQRTSTPGRVEGIYLFRATNDPNALDPAVPRTGAMPGELSDPAHDGPTDSVLSASQSWRTMLSL